jgi:RNA polymerase sigma factor (sigma-70 family)
MANDEPRTSSTLLLRLRDLEDEEAWSEFLQRYTPRIYQWCRRYNLQESDASDVTQEVLGKLLRAMRSFEYNPSKGSFRGWLKTVTNNAIRDFVSTLKHPGRGSGDTMMYRNLAAIQDPDALAALAETIEAEAEQELLIEAESRVKLRVQPHTWLAYQLTARDQIKPADAAERIGMPVSEIYVARSRVIKMLRQEVDRLGGTDGSAS